jgi:hypothetical protein
MIKSNLEEKALLEGGDMSEGANVMIATEVVSQWRMSNTYSFFILTFCPPLPLVPAIGRV